MTLWLILALMTAAAIFAVIWPLARHAGPARSGSDIAVYRDQLDEVERDLAAGLIGKTEAEAARVEISRRLLAAADAAQATPPAFNATSAAWRRRAVAVASLLALPIVAGGLYLLLGSPELASAQPVAQRNVAPAPQSIESLVAQAEAHLARNPEDGRGWEILAPVYMRLGRYSDSVAAWRNTLQLLGDSAEREANLGEALTAEANDVVTADAKAAFVRAVTLDETNVSARYYLGLAAEQDGQREKAAKIWRDLIAEAPAGAPWVTDVRNALARVESTSTARARPRRRAGGGRRQSAVRATSGRFTAWSTVWPRGSSRTGPMSTAGCGWSAPIKSSANPTRRAPQPPTPGRRLPATPTSCNGSTRRSRNSRTVPRLLRPRPSRRRAGGGRRAAGPPAGASIQDMVERLAERLKASGSDPEGWLMLVRSYETLAKRTKRQQPSVTLATRSPMIPASWNSSTAR